MSKDTSDSWAKFLDPEEMKKSLIQASLYLSAYEILKNGIVGRLKGHFTVVGMGDAYKENVRSLHPKDEFHACCIWFVQEGAMSNDDLDEIGEIRKHRNAIAHELPEFISSIHQSVDASKLQSLMEIARKIDIWWIREIEIPINPDFKLSDIEDIDWDELVGGSSLTLSIILSIFEGDESFLQELHSQFVEYWKKDKH
jgi:hypothetical protein